MSGKDKEDLKSFETANNIQTFDGSFYQYDGDQQELLREKRPWREDPVYFKNVKISGVALLKMLIHAFDGLAKNKSRRGFRSNGPPSG